jgi:hypothetical protein
VSLSTVSLVRVLSKSVSALAVLIAGLAGATSAQAGFVPALGSPFPYAAPTQELAVGDGDRSGTVDVVAGGLTLRRGVGSGFLGNPITVGATGPVEGLAAGDLNFDGLLDYMAIAPGATPSDPRRLLRFLATPGNGFVQETVVPAVEVGAATDVAVANLNGDGLPDIVFVRDGADPNVTVALGGLVTREFDSGIGSPRDVELGDLTGDGLPEIVVAGNEASVGVLVNTGAGQFADGRLEPTGAGGATRRIALTNFDGDGQLDLLATDNAAAVLLPLRGDGAASFQSLGPRPTGLAGPTASVATGDVNGDGVTDALAGGDGSFAALLGDGGGGFAPAAGSPFFSGALGGDTVTALVAADMNRDGQVDVVTANRNGSASVMLNDETGLMSPSPATVDFGTLLPASGTLTRTIVLRANRGRLRLTRLDRQGSRVLAVRDVDCLNRTLALGQTCTLSVSFNAPRKARRYEALLSVDANAAAVVVPLTATVRPPIVSRPRLKRKRVRAGQRLDLRYRLSEGALTRVLTERALRGRRVGGRCVVQTRSNARGRRCTAWQPVAKLTRRDLAGAKRMRVTTRGKPAGSGRKRKPGVAYPAGAYRLSVSALDRFRNRSAERLVRFKILSPPERPAAKRRR